MGPGARWVRTAALLLGIVLLSLRIGYTQFHGPRSEVTLQQAVVGRQLAQGSGFTTPVRYPQTLALLKAERRPVDLGAAWPELHQPPLYAAVIGTVLKAVPSSVRPSLFDTAPQPPDGFRADYLLLALNIALLWFAAWLTYALGRRLFDGWVGLLAALGLLLSAMVWEQTVAVNGTPLMMVVLLLLTHAAVRADAELGRGRGVAFFLAGLLCGSASLCDYSATLVLLPVLGWTAVRNRGAARIWMILAVVAGFLLVVSPWTIRNVRLTGHPWALAGGDVALKAGDPTADPEIVRTSLTAHGPALDLNKWGNKGLTALQAAAGAQIGSAGLLLAAFFAVGLVYRFRSEPADRARWFVLAVAAMLLASHAFLDSGEGERLPAVCLVPLFAVFGCGFFVVLVASNERLALHARWAGVALLVLQALPLAKSVAEPRRLHFSYPPYYPAVYMSLHRDSLLRQAAWMADVPAGAAWYSGQKVWAQPARLVDFYAVGSEQPVYALVLGPHTLDKSIFVGTNLASGSGASTEWGKVYAGLVTNRFPAAFPLIVNQRVSDNLYVLFNPQWLGTR